MCRNNAPTTRVLAALLRHVGYIGRVVGSFYLRLVARVIDRYWWWRSFHPTSISCGSCPWVYHIFTLLSHACIEDIIYLLFLGLHMLLQSKIWYTWWHRPWDQWIQVEFTQIGSWGVGKEQRISCPIHFLRFIIANVQDIGSVSVTRESPCSFDPRTLINQVKKRVIYLIKVLLFVPAMLRTSCRYWLLILGCLVSKAN